METSPTVEHLSDSVRREWLHDGQIVCYVILNPKRASIDTWYEAFKEDVYKWDKDKPFLVLHDISAKNVLATTYGMQRAQEMVFMRPELKGRVAVLMADSFASHMIQMFLRRFAQRKTPRIREVFLSREKAINWLTKGLLSQQ